MSRTGTRQRKIWGHAAFAAVLWGAFLFTPPHAGASTNKAIVANHRGPGFTYIHDEVPDVPWSVHIVKIDRSRAELQLTTTMGQGDRLGMGLVSDQVKSIPAGFGRAVAAVNGDFYKNHRSYPGDPEGLQIVRGELVSAPSSIRSCFWIDALGQPHHTNLQAQFKVTLTDGRSAAFGLNEERANDGVVLYTPANGPSTRTSGGIEVVLARGAGTNWLPLASGENYTAQVKEVREGGNSPIAPDTLVLSVGPKIASQVAGLKAGDVVKISTATIPDTRGAHTAIGGGPTLVRGGKESTFRGLQPRHPRTAFGWNDTHYFLVEVDGRQKVSAGMSFPELAAYMRRLGCTEAINLDGGGSATLWAYGNVMNSPSEGKERPAANALVVVRKPND
jgi:hypothetical protein